MPPVLVFPMNKNYISLHRHELYEMIWSEPMSKLAKKYGLSDVWLAKVCKKYDIPRPGRGYWAQRQAGKRVPATRLPNRSYDPLIQIRIHPERETVQRGIQDRQAQQRVPAQIAVPKILTDPYPLIRKAAKHLATSRPDGNGILATNPECLDIRVSGESAERALRLMDTLIKALHAAGFGVTVSEGATVISIDDSKIRISLQEEARRRRIRAIEHDLEGYYQFGHRLYSDRAYPMGILSLVIDDKGFPYGVLARKAWRDTGQKKLEECLSGFISGVMKAAAIMKSLESRREDE